MGSIIKPICFNCRHEFPALYIGGGMMNFTTVDDRAVLNSKTQEVETANVKQREKVLEENEHLTFYDSEELFRIHPKYTVRFPGIADVQKENYKLYFCPKCLKFEMDFFLQGLWD